MQRLIFNKVHLASQIVVQMQVQNEWASYTSTPSILCGVISRYNSGKKRTKTNMGGEFLTNKKNIPLKKE